MVNHKHGNTLKPGNRSRWRCNICTKTLSSKRSYDEHKNVHYDARPFACDECRYAAASQMTLRRHKLRNHVPRAAWGYQCPHCAEAYMEPASYQQHISSRHPGLSATFGCTFCQFTTLSSKFFREHYAKHALVIARHSNCEADIKNPAEYLVNDENGRGHLPFNHFIDRVPSFISTVVDCDPDYFKTPIRRKTETKKEPEMEIPEPCFYNESDNIHWVQSEVTIQSSVADAGTIQGYVDVDLD